MKNPKIIMIAIVGSLILILLVLLIIKSASEKTNIIETNENKDPDYTLDFTNHIKTLFTEYETRLNSLEEKLAYEQESKNNIDDSIKQLTTIVTQLSQKNEDKLIDKKFNVEEEPDIVRLTSFDLNDEVDKDLYIPAGSFGEATLLTGVYAPIAGDALPVLIKLDSILIGPNKSKVPVQGMFLVGKASGDSNTNRAIVQLHLLSVVTGKGKTIEKEINGWVTDDDGAQGIKGEYVWNAKSLVALSAISGALGGAAKFISAANTTVSSNLYGSEQKRSVDKKDLPSYARYGAAGSMASNLDKIISERISEISPAVFVSNKNQKLTIVFLTGVNLEGYKLREVNDEMHNVQNPFTGLDIDTK